MTRDIDAEVDALTLELGQVRRAFRRLDDRLKRLEDRELRRGWNLQALAAPLNRWQRFRLWARL